MKVVQYNKILEVAEQLMHRLFSFGSVALFNIWKFMDAIYVCICVISLRNFTHCLGHNLKSIMIMILMLWLLNHVFEPGVWTSCHITQNAQTYYTTLYYESHSCSIYKKITFEKVCVCMCMYICPIVGKYMTFVMKPLLYPAVIKLM